MSKLDEVIENLKVIKRDMVDSEGNYKNISIGTSANLLMVILELTELAKPTPSPWRTDIENASVCLNNERNHLGIDDFNMVYQVNVHLDARIFTHWMEIPKLPNP